jgi:hypothetical protein
LGIEKTLVCARVFFELRFYLFFNGKSKTLAADHADVSREFFFGNPRKLAASCPQGKFAAKVLLGWRSSRQKLEGLNCKKPFRQTRTPLLPLACDFAVLDLPSFQSARRFYRVP